MEIVVEIGTTDQKKLINKELIMFEELFKSYPRFKVLKKIIIAADMDKTVSELQGSSYVSQRGRHTAMARIVKKGDDWFIVFNPMLYTEGHDHYTRYLTYFHEIMHVLNGIDVEPRRDESTFASRKRVNLAIFFDEYFANRDALKLHKNTLPSTSFAFKRYVINDFNNFLNSLVDDSVYYDLFKKEIWSFRIHRLDVLGFLRRVKEPFDQVIKCVAYCFAYIDVCSHFAKKEVFLINNSKFVNDKTMALIAYVREKYESNDIELDDGLDLMVEFMTNFGMRFDDLGGGREYLNVLDI